jgi:hypothetical protein
LSQCWSMAGVFEDRTKVTNFYGTAQEVRGSVFKRISNARLLAHFLAESIDFQYHLFFSSTPAQFYANPWSCARPFRRRRRADFGHQCVLETRRRFPLLISSLKKEKSRPAVPRRDFSCIVA